MAFVLWFIVTGGPRMEEIISARLALERFIPDGWAVASPYYSRIELRLRGRHGEILKLLDPAIANALITINIDPSQIREERGVQRISLDAGNVSLPFGVEVLEVSPRMVPLQIDRLITMTVPVRIVSTGKPEEGYRLLGEPAVDPDHVEVTGAKQLVEQIETVAANLSLENKDPNDRLVVVPLDRNPLLRYNPRSVEVILDIVEENEQRRITVNPSNFVYGSGEEPVAVDVDPQEIVLIIEGPRSWVQSLEPAEVRILLNPEEVADSGERVRLEFRQEMVFYVGETERSRPQREELITIEANSGRQNPSEFYVTVTREAPNGGG